MKKLLTVMLSVLLAITTITFNVTAQKNDESIQQEQEQVVEVLEQNEEEEVNNEEVEQIEAPQLLGAAPLLGGKEKK